MKFIDIENNNGLKKFKLLFGLIYIKTVAAGCAGTVRLFGISVIKFYIRKNKIVYYFSLDFKLPIFCINAEKRQAQILKKWIDKKYHYAYDSIYCFFGSPSGELYIVLMILNELLKNNKSNKPIIIVNQKFKYDLCKLLQPNIPVLLCDKYFYFYFHTSSLIRLKQIPFYIYFPTEHYLKQDKLINKSNEHFYEYIEKENNINRQDVKKCRYNTSFNVKNKILSYIKENKLEKFVILTPEANTSSSKNNIWKMLADRLTETGYKILVNTNKLSDQIEGTIPFFFSYEELLELTKYAKAVVGLRSGLLDILTMNDNLRIIALYTDFPKRGFLESMSSSNALTGFSLKKLPFTNVHNIYEYDFNEFKDKEKLVDIILSNVTSEV